VNDSIETLAKRIDELESQAAFQDELHESLNATVAKQDGEILALQQQMILLIERFKDFGDAVAGADSQDETPPHY
jgi:SlyX protein